MKTFILSAFLLVSLAVVAESWFYYRPSYPSYGYGSYRPYSYYGSYRPYWGKRDSLPSNGRNVENNTRARWYSSYDYESSYEYSSSSSYSYSYGYGRVLSKDSFDINSVQCRLFRNESVLSCRSPNRLIECPVSLDMSIFEPSSLKWRFFGLSRNESMNYVEMPFEQQQFYMYPKDSESIEWLDNKMCVGDKCRRIKLFYSNERSCQGIRVADKDCFEDLTRMFRSIVYKLIVRVGNGSDSFKRDLFGNILFI